MLRAVYAAAAGPGYTFAAAFGGLHGGRRSSLRGGSYRPGQLTAGIRHFDLAGHRLAQQFPPVEFVEAVARFGREARTFQPADSITLGGSIRPCAQTSASSDQTISGAASMWIRASP